MLLNEFIKVYKYKSDKEKYNTSLDIWELPKVIDGKVESDCESFCRFLKKNIEGFNDWEYYYCKLNGIGHCILYKNGDVIDCNVKSIISLDKYCSLFTITELKKYNLFTVVSKIILANIYMCIKHRN